MSKLLIIDDRIIRQQNYLTFDLIKYNDVVVNCVQDKFTILQNDIQDRKNISRILNPFDYIAIHRSAFDVKVLDEILDYLKTTSKNLILFSGGISSSSLVKNVLSINSRDFYSDNLKLFCDMLKTSDHSLSVIQFGGNWKLSLLLSFREKLITEFNRSHISKDVVRLVNIDLFDQISLLVKIDIDHTKKIELDDYNLIMENLRSEISSFIN